MCQFSNRENENRIQQALKDKVTKWIKALIINFCYDMKNIRKNWRKMFGKTKAISDRFFK